MSKETVNVTFSYVDLYVALEKAKINKRGTLQVQKTRFFCDWILNICKYCPKYWNTCTHKIHLYKLKKPKWWVCHLGMNLITVTLKPHSGTKIYFERGEWRWRFPLSLLVSCDLIVFGKVLWMTILATTVIHNTF